MRAAEEAWAEDSVLDARTDEVSRLALAYGMSSLSKPGDKGPPVEHAVTRALAAASFGGHGRAHSLPEKAGGRALPGLGNDPTLSRRGSEDGMSDFVIIDGDTITVTFSTTIIPNAQGPRPLSGSSPDLSVRGAPACRKGDELPSSLRGPLTYTDGAFAVAGQGTLAVVPKTTTVLKDGKIALLVKGTTFTATFTVTQPAKMPPPVSTPDPVPVKSGTASFTTRNNILAAT
jgi:contractile injection system spike tip protein